MALGDRDLMQLPSESRGKNHVQNIDCVPRTVPAWASKTLTEIRMHSLTHSFIYSSKTMASHFQAKSCVRVSEMNLQCSKKHNKMYKIERKLHRERNLYSLGLEDPGRNDTRTEV